jgi:hypothetical protein
MRGAFGVARFDKLGDARASTRETSDKIGSTLFRMYQIVSIKKLPYWSLWILNNSNVKTEETIMSELSKILATIGVVVLFVIIFGAIAGSKSDAGQTPGILGLIVFGALIGALRAIWKKPNNK